MHATVSDKGSSFQNVVILCFMTNTKKFQSKLTLVAVICSTMTCTSHVSSSHATLGYLQ
jgi:hypothetical protein